VIPEGFCLKDHSIKGSPCPSGETEKGPVRMCSSNPFRIPVFLVAMLFAASVEAQGPYGQAPYQPTEINRYVGEAVPDIWDESQPLERFFAAVAKRSRVSLEYLHWDLDNPDPRNLGAPITDIADPTTPLNPFIPITSPLEVPFDLTHKLDGSGSPAGRSIVMNANALGLEDTPGVRGTLAVDLNGGTLEATFFGLSQNNDELLLNNLQRGRDDIAMTPTILAQGTRLRPNIVTPLLTNGAATTAGQLNALIYDESFQASIETQIWGSEITFLQEYYLPNEPFNWQWLGGFRYVSMEENVLQVGSFNKGGDLAVSQVSTIGGGTHNNMYGPEFGGRASLRTKFVSLSATPRVAFALNDHTSSVTGAFPYLADPTAQGTRVTEESIDFTPIFELNLKLQVHLTPKFSVFGGYDLFYAGQVSRPTNNTVYDSTPNGAGFDPVVRQNVVLDDFIGQGLNIGGILTY